MEQHYTKKQLEELYNCEIFKDSIEEGSFLVAYGLPLNKESDDNLFSQASGFTLDELHEDIREQVYQSSLIFSKDESDEN